MLQNQVGYSASTAVLANTQTQKLQSYVRGVRQVSFSQRRVTLNALLAVEVPTVHQELLNVPNVTWESMGDLHV